MPSINEVQIGIAAVWREILGVPAIEPADSFFELGGDSVLASVLMYRLEEAFGVVMEPFELYDAATLSELAHRISAALSPGSIATIQHGSF